MVISDDQRGGSCSHDREAPLELQSIRGRKPLIVDLGSARHRGLQKRSRLDYGCDIIRLSSRAQYATFVEYTCRRNSERELPTQPGGRLAACCAVDASSRNRASQARNTASLRAMPSGLVRLPVAIR